MPVSEYASWRLDLGIVTPSRDTVTRPACGCKTLAASSFRTWVSVNS